MTASIADLLFVLARYSAVLAVIYVALSVLAGLERRRSGIMLGTDGSDRLLRRVRAHGNFGEYVPFALILVAGAIVGGCPPWAVHAAGILLVGGRILHAAALYTASVPLRVAGMGSTYTVMLCASAFLLLV